MRARAKAHMEKEVRCIRHWFDNIKPLDFNYDTFCIRRELKIVTINTLVLFKSRLTVCVFIYGVQLTC